MLVPAQYGQKAMKILLVFHFLYPYSVSHSRIKRLIEEGRDNMK